jgi:hypothetical protein
VDANGLAESKNIFYLPKRLAADSELVLAKKTFNGICSLRVFHQQGEFAFDGKGQENKGTKFMIKVSDQDGLVAFFAPRYNMYISVGKDGRLGFTASKQKAEYFILTRGVLNLAQFSYILSSADANYRDKETGETALIKAARLGYFEYVELLVNEDTPSKKDRETAERKFHADLGARDYNGNNALMAAAGQGWLSICSLLCSKMIRRSRGSIFMINNDGWDARLSAAVYGKKHVLYFLGIKSKDSGESLDVLTDKV